MQSSDRPVLLTQTAPVTISPGELVFYDVIEAKTVSRSSVLSYIAEAGGDAKLPAAVTVPEFKAWLTACAASEEDRMRIPFRDLCTVVKVADAVDDQSLGDWAQLAAECLMPAAVRRLDGMSWGQTEDSTRACGTLCSHTAAQSLSALPDHVQRKILSMAYARDSTCMLTLLQWLPQSLHTAIVDAAITSPQRALEAHFDDHLPLPLFDALATLPAAPPSVASLHIHSTAIERTPEEIRALMTALGHHSMLSALSLNMITSTAEMELLSPAISNLSALHSLQLGGPTTQFPADAIPVLQAALHTLPQLSHLHVALDAAFELRTLKRQRDDDAAGAPQPTRCLAALLSSAPALTSLNIRLQPSCTSLHLGHPDEILPNGAAISLRHLRHLSLTVDDCAVAARLLRGLSSSPLTTLVIEQSDVGRSEHFADRARVSDSLCAFLQLRSMHVTSTPETWASRALRRALRDAPHDRTALHALTDFGIAADFGVLHQIAPQLAAAMPALRRLAVDCDCYSPTMRSAPEAWARVLGHLSALHLQHLDLSVLGYRGDCGPAMSALLPLTCLSALRLQQYGVKWRAADFELLSRMTQLQSLHLDEFRLPEDLQEYLVPALLPLRRLTRLVVSGWGVPAALAAACEEQQLRGDAWPELQQLGMQLGRSRPEAELLEVVRVVCGLSALRRIVLECDSRDHRQAASSGACGSGGLDVPMRVRAVAAAAGVAISVTKDYSRVESADA